MTEAEFHVLVRLIQEKTSLHVAGNMAIRKHVAEAIIAVSKKNQTSLGALTNAGLDVVNVFLYPPQRPG